METDIYRAPSANMNNDELQRALDAANEPDFYVVGSRKFFILFLATFGIYQFYWSYTNWARYKARSGDSIWPVMRAIFPVFFTHALFEHIDALLDARRRQPSWSNPGRTDFSWNASAVATLFVVLRIVENIVDRLADKGIGAPYSLMITLALVPLMSTQLHIAQTAVNVACDDPDGESNSALTGANYAWISLGVVFWILIIIGLFVR